MPGEDESQLLKSLKQACDLGNTGQARRALGAWLDRFGPVNASGSLLDFAADLEDQSLRAGVYAMDADGFRPDSNGRWDSKLFWKQFEAWRKTWQASLPLKSPPSPTSTPKKTVGRERVMHLDAKRLDIFLFWGFKLTPRGSLSRSGSGKLIQGS